MVNFLFFLFLSSNLLLTLRFYYIFLSILTDRNSCKSWAKFLILYDLPSFDFYVFILNNFREVNLLTSLHYIYILRVTRFLNGYVKIYANWIFWPLFLQRLSKNYSDTIVYWKKKTFNFLRYLLPRSTSFLVIVVHLAIRAWLHVRLRERNGGNFQRNETPN